MVKRIRSSQIGEKAELLVEKIFNDANWVCNRLYHGYGLDLHVKVVEFEHVVHNKSLQEVLWQNVCPDRSLYITIQKVDLLHSRIYENKN